MKCPECKTSISNRDSVPTPDGESVYQCSGCEKLLVRAHSLPFFMIVFAVFVPIADGILTGVVESLLHDVLGGQDIFGVEMIRLISMAASVCLFLVILYFLRTLKPVKENLAKGAIDDAGGVNSKDG